MKPRLMFFGHPKLLQEENISGICLHSPIPRHNPPAPKVIFTDVDQLSVCYLYEGLGLQAGNLHVIAADVFFQSNSRRQKIRVGFF
jgi:hypothetical protein